MCGVPEGPVGITGPSAQKQLPNTRNRDLQACGLQAGGFLLLLLQLVHSAMCLR